MWKPVVLVSLAFALAASLPAAAQEVRTANFHYADLDLARPAGKAAVMARVRAVLPTVCGQPDASAPWPDVAVERCRSAALNDAARQIETASMRARAWVSVALR